MTTGLVDIHAHVLPGIDDGPSDSGEALEMLRAAHASGITVLAATPHLRSDFPHVNVRRLAESCADMRRRISEEKLPLELVSGAEVSVVWALEASAEELALASFGQQATDLLIETPTAGTAGLEELLYRLRARAYRITLAHPERSPDFQRNPVALARLVEQGILLQVNAQTLLGNERRSRSSSLGARLCRGGLVHAIASDAHRATSWRPMTLLPEAVEAAASLVGPERARWMSSDAPAAIVAGRDLPEPPAVVVRRRRFRRWSR
ncbi:MAG: tyrosine-protein phosphatase [Solirubrobacteraceae bacterium]